ncbi:MAG: bi-domain-containing oxidoreductase, partial [bacterium]
VGTIVYTTMGDPRVSKERYEVVGEGKVAVLDDFRALEITAKGKTKTTRTLRADKGHEAELRAFIAACTAGAPSPIAWPSIEATTRATFAIEHAWRECAMVEIA